MDLQTFIVNRIEKIKDVRGISTSELARRSNISRIRLTRILSGERDLKAAEMVWLCVALSVPIEALLPESTFRRAATPNQGTAARQKADRC